MYFPLNPTSAPFWQKEVTDKIEKNEIMPKTVSLGPNLTFGRKTKIQKCFLFAKNDAKRKQLTEPNSHFSDKKK